MMKTKEAEDELKAFVASIRKALRRAGKAARKTARMYNTPVYVWRDGKIVAEKP